VALVWQALRPIANITADEITLRFFKRHYGPEEAIDSLEPFRATLLKRCAALRTGSTAHYL
jgi:hypothetical protein